ncbi:MAG: type II toxin-antitoxin system VapC family toxin [Bacteroidales bacterium]|jgi:PIN domain nuclease of toxin-antitoxin system|nr:type II toxin-antitoxin system VapC family toxin [Bacteroidales bacterium]
MRYLIDTNILLYILENDNLSKEVYDIVWDYENSIYISSESIKELIHLFHIGKIRPHKLKNVQDIFYTIEHELGYFINYVKKEHLQTMARLDLAPAHNDPSDHLIIAQAITEKIPLISSDRKFEAYRKQKLNFIYNKK